MHKIEIPEKEITLYFPENIYELTGSQYHYYVQLYLMLSKAHINFEEFRALLVYHFMNMTYSSKSDPEKDGNLGRLIELTKDFYEQAPGGSQVRPVIFCPLNLAREFSWEGQKFTGPANALADVTLRQFLDGLTLMNSYRKSEEERKYLVKLFALFHTYHKQFRKKDLPVSEQLAAKLPDYMLYGFYFFFCGSVEFLTSQDIHLDDGRQYNFSPIFSSADAGAESIGPVNVLFTLADSGVFGDEEKAAQINIIKALSYLLQNHYDNQKLKKK